MRSANGKIAWSTNQIKTKEYLSVNQSKVKGGKHESKLYVFT